MKTQREKNNLRESDENGRGYVGVSDSESERLEVGKGVRSG